MREADDNPWRRVTVDDYDGHMASPAVAQAPILDGIFADVLRRYRPATIAVPGCGTGTGLRHIDPTVTTRVLAVELNTEFLATVMQRHGSDLPNVELLAADLETMAPPAGRFDLIHVALVFEHVDPTLVLPRLARWLLPSGTMTIVLQLPSSLAPATTNTPFASLAPISGHMSLVAPDEVRALAAEHGLREVDSSHHELPQGKSFRVGHFRVAGAVSAEQASWRAGAGETFAPAGTHDLRPSEQGGLLATEVVALASRELPADPGERARAARWGGRLLIPRGS